MTQNIVLDIKDPDLEKKLQDIQQTVLGQTEKQSAKLGKILRRRGLFSFKMFLRKHKIKLPKEQVPLFMDYLITKRSDLKDLEPEARRRLRQYKLKDQPEHLKTRDYLIYIESELAPTPPLTCKNCRWFMSAPPGYVDSCVELGTKGADDPCYGYTKK
jgi:hypothetical protein